MTGLNFVSQDSQSLLTALVQYFIQQLLTESVSPVQCIYINLYDIRIRQNLTLFTACRGFSYEQKLKEA